MSEKPCNDHFCFHVECYNKSREHYHLNSKDETCMCRICYYTLPRCENKNCGSGIYKNLINEPKGTCKYCDVSYDYSNEKFETNSVATEEDKLNHINSIIRFMYENNDVCDNDPSTRDYIDILDKLGVKLLFKYNDNFITTYNLVRDYYRYGVYSDGKKS
jgi:hypothetical protein